MQGNALTKPLIKAGNYNYRASISLSRKNENIKEFSKNRKNSISTDPVICKAEENDLREAIFNFLVNSFGTGCLSLPIILKYAGLIPGILIIILAAYISYLSMNSVSVAAERKNLFNYSKLVKKLLGPNTLLFLDIILVLYYFFLVMGFHLICIESILTAFMQFHLDLNDFKPWIMIGCSFFIVFPLSLFKELVENRIFNYFTISSILYICFCIVLDMPSYVKEHNMKDLKLYKFDWYFFTAFNFALFSYACQRRVTSVFAKMKNHSLNRMKRVNFRVCFYQMMFYIIFAVIGYLSLLDNTPLFITKRDPLDSFSSSFALFVARVLVAIIFLYTMPIFVILCRESTQSLILKHKRQTFSFFWKGYFNFLIISTALILSYFLPETLLIFKFLGSFSAVYSFVFPALIDIVSNPDGWYYPGNLGRLLLALSLTTAAFMSSFLTLYLSS